MQKNTNILINEVYRQLFIFILGLGLSIFLFLSYLGLSCKKTFLSITYTFGQMKAHNQSVQYLSVFTEQNYRSFLTECILHLIYGTTVRNHCHYNCVLCSNPINGCSRGLFRTVFSKLCSWALLPVYKHSS